MSPTILFVSLVIAVAPMVAMLFFIWWMDRYDREPLRYVFGSFLWGAFGAFALSFVFENYIPFGEKFSPENGHTIAFFVGGPTIEELMKGLSVFFLLRYRDFDNVTDGLVYGAASGLGFGMSENFLYFIGNPGHSPIVEWLNLLFIRTVFTANMHCAATATFGAGISYLKNRGWSAIPSVIAYYLIALILHTSWNILSISKNPETGGFGILLLLVYFGAIFLLFVFDIRKERKQRKQFLSEEFSSGILPQEFEKTLFSYNAMQKNNWFPE
jgi:RsiW-degrading membrane proteinase PrsW (M82 family)